MFGKNKSKEEVEALLDDAMLSGGLGVETSDQAKAQAIVKLAEDNTILSDLDDVHINIGTGMLTMNKWLKDNGVKSVIVECMMGEIIRLRIPRKRKSRGELVEVVKTEGAASLGTKLKKRLGF